MTDDAKQCTRTGCTSGGRWFPRLHLVCPEPGGVARRPMFDVRTMLVCDTHKDEALVRDYVLSEENKAVIVIKLREEAGFEEPDWLQVRIEFVPAQREQIKVLPPCTREGCILLGRWQIVQRFKPGKGKAIRTIDAITNLRCCDVHKLEVAASPGLVPKPDAAMWLAVDAKFSEWGFPKADRGSVEIIFEDIGAQDGEDQSG